MVGVVDWCEMFCYCDMDMLMRCDGRRGVVRGLCWDLGCTKSGNAALYACYAVILATSVLGPNDHVDSVQDIVVLALQSDVCCCSL